MWAAQPKQDKEEVKRGREGREGGVEWDFDV